MTSIERRLTLVKRAVDRLPPPWAEPRFDYDRLEVAELEELEALAIRVGQKPNGRADFSDLTDDELDRLAVLTEKSQIHPGIHGRRDGGGTSLI